MTNTSEIIADQVVLTKMMNCRLWGQSYLAIPMLLRRFPKRFWKEIKDTIQKLQKEGILLTKMKKGEACISLNPRKAGEIYQQIAENEEAK